MTSTPAAAAWMMTAVVLLPLHPFAFAIGTTTFAVSVPISWFTRLNQWPPGIGTLIAMKGIPRVVEDAPERLTDPLDTVVLEDEVGPILDHEARIGHGLLTVELVVVPTEFVSHEVRRALDSVAELNEELALLEHVGEADAEGIGCAGPPTVRRHQGRGRRDGKTDSGQPRDHLAASE